jgi:hypothetical protein
LRDRSIIEQFLKNFTRMDGDGKIFAIAKHGNSFFNDSP